jgi:hypothetical protein
MTFSKEATMTRSNSENGVALLTVLLLIVLTSAMLAGFASLTISDERLRALDRTRTGAFYAAHGALEKLTADLGNLFSTNFAPTMADLAALTVDPPDIPGVTFEAPDGGPGYVITPTGGVDAQGNPVAQSGTVSGGPYQGFTALITPYSLAVVARTQDGTDSGSEAWLQRQMQTVAIPVFQFGVFSETDVSFFAGPNFNFGGRVHTNGNLFLASGNGSTLTMANSVTAVREVVRTNLSNGWDTNTNYTGNVSIVRAPGAFRNLGTNEGSLTGTIGSAQNEPTWTNLSLGVYNGNLRNGRTGARTLTLPFVTLGATPIDLIRRGIPGEQAVILDQRYFAMASLRILLSDTAAEITGLPTVTGVAPVQLGNLALNPVPGYGPIDATRAPFAVAGGALPYRSAAGTALLDGFIKIELQRPDGNWQDVTLEILNLGIAARRLPDGAVPGGAPNPVCADPTPNAVIRLQRVKNPPAFAAPCGTGSINATDYYPLSLYDPREGNLRDANPNPAPAAGNINQGVISLGGVMYYIELDVRNLSRWFQGQIGASGPNALNLNGYTVYFSDRRNNKNAGQETGEYGWEDFVNPGDGAGVPNTVLEDGEDVNGNGLRESYGMNPTNVPPPAAGGAGLYTAAARPWTNMNPAAGAAATYLSQVNQVKANRPLLFRRALKLVNGGFNNLVQPGLTIASENPVYVEGNYNANAAGFGNRPGDTHAAAAIIADAVTFLSNSWNDNQSFAYPQTPNARLATDTWYRVAILAGKGPSFPRPTAWASQQDFGTDGGVHNFLRYIENWGGRTLNFRGAIASFFFNRQAVGTYKCCTNVYSPPTRAYAFDVEFLQPNWLPPRTPMFRDINTTGFTQVIK